MSDSNATLKPCPFCGGEAVVQKSWERVLIECDCNAKYGHGAYVVERTEAEAVEAWNTRYHSVFEETVIKAWEEIKSYQERTCSIVEHPELPYPVCSDCGAVQPDDFTVYFCWSCGAKVVGE